MKNLFRTLAIIACLIFGANSANAADKCVRTDVTATATYSSQEKSAGCDGGASKVESTKPAPTAANPTPANKKAPSSNSAALKALADENAALKAELSSIGIRTTVTPIAPVPAATVASASAVVATAMPPTKSKSVLVTFGHRARIFDQEGNLMAFRYVKDEAAANEFEANFRAKVADPDAVVSVQEFRQVQGVMAPVQTTPTAANISAVPTAQSKQTEGRCPKGLIFGKVVADITDQYGRSLKGQDTCTEPGNPSVQPL